MSTDLWQYEYPIWLSNYKNNKLFGLLPPEIIKIIISNLIHNVKERIKKQILIKNLQQIKAQIYKIFDKHQENFHFENENVCDMDLVKSIIKYSSKIKNKPIKISHICCHGKGLVFTYKNKDTHKNPNNNYLL